MTKRILAGMALAAIGFSATVSAQPTSPTPVTPGVAAASITDSMARSFRMPTAAAIALLTKRVEGVNWEDTPFEEVIDWLKAEGGGRVNIVPRWSQLSVESVDRDSLVTLELGSTTISEVLAEALDQLDEGGGAITYHAEGNTLRISTKADFDRKLFVRVYDVTDLLFQIPDFAEEAPQIDLQNTSSGGGGGGAGQAAQSVFQGGGGAGGGSNFGGQQAEQERADRLAMLPTLITTIIAPQSWTVNNPAALGAIIPHDETQSLVVLATMEVHEQIGGRFFR